MIDVRPNFCLWCVNLCDLHSVVLLKILLFCADLRLHETGCLNVSCICSLMCLQLALFIDYEHCLYGASAHLQLQDALLPHRNRMTASSVNTPNLSYSVLSMFLLSARDLLFARFLARRKRSFNFVWYLHFASHAFMSSYICSDLQYRPTVSVRRFKATISLSMQRWSPGQSFRRRSFLCISRAQNGLFGFFPFPEISRWLFYFSAGHLQKWKGLKSARAIVPAASCRAPTPIPDITCALHCASHRCSVMSR